MLSLEVGRNYYLRTFGEHWVGRVAALTPTEVRLEGAAWVADSGRLHEFVRDGRASNTEVEPVGQVTVPAAYVAAYLPWPHPLFMQPI